MGVGPVRVAHVMHGLMMGGLEQVVVRLCEAGRQFGVEPTVIAFGADGSVKPLLARHQIPLAYLGEVPGMSPQAISGIARALRDHRIDVAHAHDLGPWFNLVAARALAPQIKPVVTFHQIATPRRATRLAAMGASLVTDALIACGNEVKSCVEEWAPAAARVELIGNGVPIGPEPTKEDRRAARQKLGLPEDAVVIGYLGRLHPEKGGDLLVDAFLREFADRPNVHLALIGRGELEDLLRRKVSRVPKAIHRVHFLGEIMAASTLLCGFDIYVQPSRREGRSLAMLEAMAAALPTVAQGLPAMTEIHVPNETALIVPPSERPSFGPAIVKLVDDVELRTRLGARARQHVQRFSVEAMAQQYAELYRNITASSERRPSLVTAARVLFGRVTSTTTETA